MALKQTTFNLAAFNDSEAGGNNYFAGIIFEVYKTNDTLADIFSDAAGANPINQDGIENVSDSSGRCNFYIEDGSYYIKIGANTENFTVGISADLINDLSQVHQFSTVSAMKASTINFPDEKVLRVGGYYAGWAALNNDTSVIYTKKTAAQAVIDGDVIDTWGNHTMASGDVAIINEGISRINMMKWGAKGDGVQDDSLPTLAALAHVADKYPHFGGVTIYFPASPVEYKFLSPIDLGAIFNLTTPVGQRLTQVWFKGDGRASIIKFDTTAPALFTFGHFANNVGMTGGVKDMKLVGSGVSGHTGRVFNPAFTSLSSGVYGTTNVTSTAIEGAVLLSGFVVDNVEISQFDRGINYANGFAPIVTNCNITNCNVGVEFSTLVTSATLGDGNSIELCAIGWYLNAGAQMCKSSGVNVIEANDVDVVVYSISHLHTIDQCYFEGSRRSIYICTEATADQFTPKQLTVRRCIGMDVEFNGGALDVKFQENSWSGGVDFGINTNQRLQHIVFEDNYTGNRAEPFDASLIVGSGIYSQFTDEVSIVSSGIDTPNILNGDPKIRPNSDMRQKKRFYKTSPSALIEGFSLDIPNLKTGALIVIEGHKNYDIEAAGALPNVVFFKYVGVVQRNTGGATTINWSATGNVFESFATTLTPHTVTTPTTSVSGAVGATQTVQFDFIQGYTGDISAGHYYEVSINSSIGNVKFS